MSDEVFGRYTPAQLSPVPIKPRPGPLPYSLTWGNLADCLPEFASGIASWIGYEKQGLHGGSNSQILTVSYEDPRGGRRTETVFVKRCSDPARREADRYAFLTDCGFPAARLLLAVSREDSEIVVLEFLPAIGIEATEADDLLQLVARLNAISSFPPEVFRLPPGMPAGEFSARVRNALRRLTNTDAYFEAYQQADLSALPRCLTHGEFSFQQVGWTGSRRLVLFDLETMGPRPRFHDIATILPGLVALTGRSERDLFGRYLDLLGSAMPEEQAWQELRLTRSVVTFESLPWLVTFASQDMLAAVLRQLRADLGWD